MTDREQAIRHAAVAQAYGRDHAYGRPWTLTDDEILERAAAGKEAN